jgi:hypothetical protein
MMQRNAAGSLRVSLSCSFFSSPKSGGPEGPNINPMDFVELAKSSVKLAKKKGLPIVVECVD